MREIKYRAWDKKAGEMLRVDELFLVHNSNKFGKGILDEHNDFHPMDEIELIQSTGLFDKNGKEIFEGDIIKSDYSEFIYEVVFATKGYFAGAFCLKNLKGEKKYRGFSQESIWMPNDEPKNFDEVIGNRFENPELLEV